MIKMDDKEIKRFERDLKNFARRAYPFATKQTVNAAAWDARGEAQTHLGRDMVLRNQWTKQSVRVEQTKTLQVRKQMALVGSIEDYLERQEFGGTVVKKGKQGVPLATSYSAGLPMGQQPRTKLPTKRHKLENIKLRHGAAKGRGRTMSRKQRNLVAMKQAAKAGSKMVYMDLGEKKGIFRVFSKKKPKMIYDLSLASVRTPRNPWLAPSVAKTQKKIPDIYLKALKFQIDRQQIFKNR